MQGRCCSYTSSIIPFRRAGPGRSKTRVTAHSTCNSALPPRHRDGISDSITLGRTLRHSNPVCPTRSPCHALKSRDGCDQRLGLAVKGLRRCRPFMHIASCNGNRSLHRATRAALTVNLVGNQGEREPCYLHRPRSTGRS